MWTSRTACFFLAPIYKRYLPPDVTAYKRDQILADSAPSFHTIMSSPPHSEVDVLIIGAGPAGLMCANALANARVNVRIVDKR